MKPDTILTTDNRQQTGLSMEKLISVIIPVYNTEQYIGRCLESIIANDYKNLEIICVNDGSTDNSLNILRKYEEKDSRFKVIDVPNSGVSNTRNIGIDISSGEFIAFIDSDDCVHHQYFSILIASLINDDSIMSICDWQMFFDENEIIRKDFSCVISKKGKIKELLYSKYSANCWCRLYKKSAISGIRFPFELSNGEDGVFNREVMVGNKEDHATLIKEKLYYYFQRKDSASHTTDLYKSTYKKIDWYIYNAKIQINREHKEYYIRFAIENALGFRYHAKKDSKNDYITKFNAQLVNAIDEMKSDKLFSKKERIKYSAFSAFPSLYCAVADRNKRCNKRNV